MAAYGQFSRSGFTWARGSMVVAVLAMHVAMGDLLGAGGAHAGDLQREAQRLSGQRVVAVEQDGVALDLHDVENVRMAVIGAALELSAHLDTGRELAFR